MSAPIPVILLGLGPIGRAIGQAVAAEGRLEVVGAVDIDPVIVGKPLHHVCDADLPPLLVVSDLADTHAPPGAVVLQATGSRLETVQSQLLQAIALGYHVVSTCEELVWPWDDHPDRAGELNRACRRAQVAVLGVGVNPGFIMDTLPVLVARAAGEVEAVHVIRVVDVAKRRLSLQRKMGVGEDPAVVQSLLDQERIGHVGLSNSLQMLAAGLGWKLDMIDIDGRPIIAKETVMTASGPIEAGRCLGIRQQATGMVLGRPRLFLHLVMEAGVATGSYDEIVIDGAQSLRLRLEGLQGDQATAWLVVNQALIVRQLPPGLHTMLSAPLLPMS